MQGRITKGLLFFFCVYGLFFYGMYIGSGSVTLGKDHYNVIGNVYLPATAEPPTVEPGTNKVIAGKNNPWGLWVFPANLYNRPQYLGQFWAGVVAWPALYHYAFPAKADKNEGGVWSEIKNFESTPSEEALNAVNTSGDKIFELGWVYTVIAGVLNIMVIYDAFAGPAFPAKKEDN
jgi:hypothetical protein